MPTRFSSSFFRSALVVLLVFATFACSGGGCSGCAGCGIAPIPGGFPIAQQIPNAAQVRLSSSAIAFIEENVGAILPRVLPDGLDFPVERGDQGAAIICSSDPTAGDGMTDCFAHIEVDSLDLEPVEGTNQLNAHVRAIAESRDETGVVAAWQVRVLASECLLTIDTRGGDRPYVGVRAELALEEIDREARAGATKLAVRSIGVVEDEGVEPNDFSITHLNWWDGGPIACGIANTDLVRGAIAGTITNAVQGLLNGALSEQLCTRRGELGCPTGTHDRGDTAADAICYYDPAPPSEGADECVPTLLGFEGRGDLGAQLLGGFSPGTHGSLQFALAAGGDGEAVDEGMTLFLSGGMMSFDRAFETTPGHAVCVPSLEPPALPEVARVDAFRGNVIPGTDIETHVGIGIAEDFLDHAGYGMFDSGMLCLAAGTRLSQLLSTGLVSAIAGSLRTLAYPSEGAPLMLALRPQQPPDFTISETAPQLTVTLPELRIDFYVWSTERYVRFMTFQSDLAIHLGIAVEGGQIVLRVDSVDVAEPVVTNSELLIEPPEMVATALGRLVPRVAGMLAGAIPPISLPDIMGFELDVPPEGVRGVDQDGERFLGIFANLRLAESAVRTAIDTTIEVGDLELDRESMTLERFATGEGNAAWLHLGAGGAAPGTEYEYSHRVDGTTWSEWSSTSRVRIDDPVLLLQGRHEIEARARVAGDARSVDATPARATLIVDVIAPDVQLSRLPDGTAYVASASDIVTGARALRYRFRVRGGEWTDWSNDARYEPDALVLDGRDVDVEVVDEAGNVGVATLPLIRGIPNPTGGGCACRTAADRSSAGTSAMLVALGIVLVIGRRRRR
ncbi:MYXO-CTERM sorting domain-containing protein [Sandaracinus amylolyticus]|uniref:Uncharacterized protein n=1 Tax=Sandaracinus amylolyticus TaxID=927083 RepID=A0A0F6W7P7_9BACT|nr:MYXO-CTERM sorting domain-containing protein [Sandaracinus amylolyticus]AKF09396.1 hypothetical protein DB32_006545 [Sandaracinus amylolyticus]